jgi:cob(I)alamin adenosyltransferase
MKIYTKTGDDGKTGLFGGTRVAKDDVRVEAYGTLDELNSALGVARAHDLPAEISGEIDRIQQELFDVGAEVASVPEKLHKLDVPRIGEGSIARLERAIDASENELEPLSTFILPGGSIAASHLHVARAVCRRAERRMISLAASSPVLRGEIVRYLNRLGDLLFSWARLANRRASIEDVKWIRGDRG